MAGTRVHLLVRPATVLHQMLAGNFALVCCPGAGTFSLRSAKKAIPVTSTAADCLLENGLVSLSSDGASELVFLLTAEGRRRGQAAPTICPGSAQKGGVESHIVAKPTASVAHTEAVRRRNCPHYYQS